MIPTTGNGTSTPTTSSGAASSSQSSNAALGSLTNEQTFLQLLVAQLQNQIPRRRKMALSSFLSWRSSVPWNRRSRCART